MRITPEMQLLVDLANNMADEIKRHIYNGATPRFGASCEVVEAPPSPDHCFKNYVSGDITYTVTIGKLPDLRPVKKEALDE